MYNSILHKSRFVCDGHYVETFWTELHDLFILRFRIFNIELNGNIYELIDYIEFKL